MPRIDVNRTVLLEAKAALNVRIRNSGTSAQGSYEVLQCICLNLHRAVNRMSIWVMESPNKLITSKMRVPSHALKNGLGLSLKLLPAKRDCGRNLGPKRDREESRRCTGVVNTVCDAIVLQEIGERLL